MTTSVFFTNNYIRVVTGTSQRRGVQIEKACQIELPAGCMINGLITDESVLKDTLQELWKKHQLSEKGIQVSSASSHFSIKVVNAPSMNRKGTMEFLSHEMSSEGEDVTIIDYQKLGTDKASKMNQLAAVAAEREFVESYVKLFGDLGIRVESVRPSRLALFSMFDRAGLVQNKSCIILLAEGNDLQSILYIDGVYTYATKARLFSERGSEGIGTEIARSVSGVQQFLMTQKTDCKVEEVYLAGMQPEEMEYSRAALDMLEAGLITRELDGSFVRMPVGIRFTDYVSPVADLMAGKEVVNLLGQMKAKTRRVQVNEELIQYGRPVLLLALVVALAVAVLNVMNFRKQSQLNELLEYNMDSANVEAYQEALLLENQVNELSATVNEVDNFSSVKDSYPWADMSVFTTIQQAASGLAQVEIGSYEDDNGSLQLAATAENVSNINQFIAALENTGVFESVEYSGYTLTDNEEQQQYSIRVICHLAVDAGK